MQVYWLTFWQQLLSLLVFWPFLWPSNLILLADALSWVVQRVVCSVGTWSSGLVELQSKKQFNSAKYKKERNESFLEPFKRNWRSRAELPDQWPRKERTHILSKKWTLRPFASKGCILLWPFANIGKLVCKWIWNISEFHKMTKWPKWLIF